MCFPSYTLNGSYRAVFAEFWPISYHFGCRKGAGGRLLSVKLLSTQSLRLGVIAMFCWFRRKRGVYTPPGHSRRSMGLCSMLLSIFSVRNVSSLYCQLVICFVVSLGTARCCNAICTVLQVPSMWPRQRF